MSKTEKAANCGTTQGSYTPTSSSAYSRPLPSPTATRPSAALSAPSPPTPSAEPKRRWRQTRLQHQIGQRPRLGCLSAPLVSSRPPAVAAPRERRAAATVAKTPSEARQSRGAVPEGDPEPAVDGIVSPDRPNTSSSTKTKVCTAYALSSDILTALPILHPSRSVKSFELNRPPPAPRGDFSQFHKTGSPPARGARRNSGRPQFAHLHAPPRRTRLKLDNAVRRLRTPPVRVLLNPFAWVFWGSTLRSGCSSRRSSARSR